ncbi:MAG TPA: hypothetical protein VFP25_00070 [Nitrososphaeraceae archaeon]|nr:hypothetical protein [Nitrososphaeraceae archaeon]
MGDDKHKENQSHKRDVSYNTKSKSDNIQEERSIDIENNQDEEDTKEIIIERMIDRNNNNKNSNTDTYTNRNTISSIDNRIIYDLQTLLSQRQERLWSVLHERYQYNTSIKRAQDFLLNHVDSKLSLVVMYADLVGSTKMSMALPVEKMADNQSLFS